MTKKRSVLQLRSLFAVVVSLTVAVSGPLPVRCQDQPDQPVAPTAVDSHPRSSDPDLVIELIAEQPDVVTPTGLAVDRQGRVFVAESHTHFRPDNYDGPERDRILLFTDADSDGNWERRVVHEGLVHTMDLEFHHDGSLYVATRRDIHRIELDDEATIRSMTRIVNLETTGDYPHNGISGLAFDFRGDLHFGLGENLGHPYELSGTDGVTLSGGGEGGSTYHVRADGSGLRRVSTGWWNPFGMCVDGLGRVFGTDNDPGASPPCRLIQVVNDADYGYEYRYGRSGLHPLITWTGSIPGTLPMISGTGEAPCAILSYESTALPSRYYGHLITASWADHRLENYPLTQHADRGLVSTHREILVEGGNDFRPVSVAVGPDGSLYVTDWVSASYSLHGQGRIWRVRSKTAETSETDATREGIESRDRFVREHHAREMTTTARGRNQLADLAASHQDAYVRAAALSALATIRDEPPSDIRWYEYFQVEKDPRVRLLIMDLAMRSGHDPAPYFEHQLTVAERAVALSGASLAKHEDPIQDALDANDARLFRAAVLALADSDINSRYDDIYRSHPLATVLALRHATRQRSLQASLPAELKTRFPDWLNHENDAVRYVAVKWIADEQLSEFRAEVESLLSSPQTDYRLFLAAAAALLRLDGEPPQDRPANKQLVALLKDETAPENIRSIALRMIDPQTAGLVELVKPLTTSGSEPLQYEAVQTLASLTAANISDLLVTIAGDEQRSPRTRAAAIAGLAGDAQQQQALLVNIAVSGTDELVSSEALRSLIGVELTEASRDLLEKLAAGQLELAEAVQRLIKGQPGKRPDASDPEASEIDRWLQLIAGKGDAQLGEQVFFGTKVGTCARCHAIDGRGTDVGPDLSLIARRLEGRGPQADRWLLETILRPSDEMAPQYTPWIIVTTDGKTHIGLPRRKGGSAEAYLGTDGKEFTLRKTDIEFHKEHTKSVMPDDLLSSLTLSELRGLFTFLKKSADGPSQEDVQEDGPRTEARSHRGKDSG